MIFNLSVTDSTATTGCTTYVYYSPFPTEAEIQAALEEQRIESRRIIPATFVKKPLYFLIVSPLIRWMAKALIGGQK